MDAASVTAEFHKYSSYGNSNYKKINDVAEASLFVNIIRLEKFFKIGKFELGKFHCIFSIAYQDSQNDFF